MGEFRQPQRKTGNGSKTYADAQRTALLLCYICLLVFKSLGHNEKGALSVWACVCLLLSNSKQIWAESHKASAFQGWASPAKQHQLGVQQTSHSRHFRDTQDIDGWKIKGKTNIRCLNRLLRGAVKASVCICIYSLFSETLGGRRLLIQQIFPHLVLWWW